jgi:hypothetical protein
VCTENNRGIVGNVIEFLDKYCTKTRQAIHHETVVHNFVADVNRRAEQFKRTLNDFDRPVYAGALASNISIKRPRTAF